MRVHVSRWSSIESKKSRVDSMQQSFYVMQSNVVSFPWSHCVACGAARRRRGVACVRGTVLGQKLLVCSETSRVGTSISLEATWYCDSVWCTLLNENYTGPTYTNSMLHYGNVECLSGFTTLLSHSVAFLVKKSPISTLNVFPLNMSRLNRWY